MNKVVAKLSLAIFACAVMLPLMGCPHRDHHDDHHPPPPEHHDDHHDDHHDHDGH